MAQKNPAQDNPLRLVPSKKARAEIEILRSRFITELVPAEDVKTARDFIHQMQIKYADASHWVPAFVIGHGNSVITHASDAGEPSGTAGQPALRVLQGSGLGNVCAVVTRYFGGIKLGTGGLSRAYADAVKAVLENVQISKLVAVTRLSFSHEYSLYEPVGKLVAKLNGVVLSTDFSENVREQIQLEDEKIEDFQNALRELSRGQVHAEVIGHEPDFPVPFYPAA